MKKGHEMRGDWAVHGRHQKHGLVVVHWARVYIHPEFVQTHIWFSAEAVQWNGSRYLMIFYEVIDPCTDSPWLSRCRFLRTHTQSNFGFTNLLWRIDTTGGAAVRLMIIREGGRGKSGRLCAHCQAGDCTLCIGSIVEAQPVQTCSLKGL